MSFFLAIAALNIPLFLYLIRCISVVVSCFLRCLPSTILSDKCLCFIDVDISIIRKSFLTFGSINAICCNISDIVISQIFKKCLSDPLFFKNILRVFNRDLSAVISCTVTCASRRIKSNTSVGLRFQWKDRYSVALCNCFIFRPFFIHTSK